MKDRLGEEIERMRQECEDAVQDLVNKVEDLEEELQERDILINVLEKKLIIYEGLIEEIKHQMKNSQYDIDII